MPVVHAVGGLADTVLPATPQHLQAGTASGFPFDNYTAAALDAALQQACTAYRNQPQFWDQLVRAGMLQDWSWAASAQKYVQLYRDILSRTKQPVCA